MGYHPHTPHHIQSPMGINNGLDPKFPPVADDCHQFNNHYASMTASTGPMMGCASGGMVAGDYLPATNHQYNTSSHQSAPSHSFLHHNSTFPGHQHHHHHHHNHSHHHHLPQHELHHPSQESQDNSYSSYLSSSSHSHHLHHHPHPHQHPQSHLSYYGHHPAVATASTIQHHAPEYISTDTINADAVTNLATTYSAPVLSPNAGGAISSLTPSDYYVSGYYGAVNGSGNISENTGPNTTNISQPQSQTLSQTPNNSTSHHQIMDMPLQCISTEPPINTVLGLQELGKFAILF